MQGRSLHDALLTVLADGEVRSRLLTSSPSNQVVAHRISDEDWATLSALSGRRLIGISRFLARQYYRERVVRLFRYVRLLIPVTGRDPCTLLQGPSILPILDRAVLGSPQSAERLLAMIEPFLTDHDEEIQARFPFWRDLIRYQSTLFRVEAEANVRTVPIEGSEGRPRRAASSRVLALDWDLPGLLQQLRRSNISSGEETSGLIPQRIATTLLVACGRYGRITTVRCDRVTRTLLEAADGQRDEQQLAQIAGISPDQVGQLLRQLQEIGAIAQASGLSSAESEQTWGHV
jgi:hypothetical protein